MKVFITGVSGFIGCGLVSYLKNVPGISLYGHSRNLVETSRKFIDSAIVLVPDYSASRFNELEIDVIIHLAGIAHDLNSKFKAVDYNRVNGEGTVAVFEDFIQSRTKKFIFVSSIKAAIDASVSPVDEKVLPNPTSDYGKSKLIAETYIQNYNLPGDKAAYIFRPVMVHGPGNKGNLNLLYRYVRSGLPYLFGKYENHRSFLAAENLHYVLMRFLQSEYPSGTYHLADDRTISTNELIRIISKSLGREPRIWNFPASLLDAFSTCLSTIGLPSDRFKQKLTESLVVSSAKVKQVLGESFPVDAETGLLRTLHSFNE